MKKIIFLIIILFLFLLGCVVEDNQGNTSLAEPLCLYQAEQYSQQSKEYAQKELDMGCSGIVSSDALYATCVETIAEHKAINRKYDELYCTSK